MAENESRDTHSTGSVDNENAAPLEEATQARADLREIEIWKAEISKKH
jgi:hypothetical protein